MIKLSEWTLYLVLDFKEKGSRDENRLILNDNYNEFVVKKNKLEL